MSLGHCHVQSIRWRARGRHLLVALALSLSFALGGLWARTRRWPAGFAIGARACVAVAPESPEPLVSGGPADEYAAWEEAEARGGGASWAVACGAAAAGEARGGFAWTEDRNASARLQALAADLCPGGGAPVALRRAGPAPDGGPGPPPQYEGVIPPRLEVLEATLERDGGGPVNVAARLQALAGPYGLFLRSTRARSPAYPPRLISRTQDNWLDRLFDEEAGGGTARGLHVRYRVGAGPVSEARVGPSDRALVLSALERPPAPARGTPEKPHRVPARLLPYVPRDVAVSTVRRPGDPLDATLASLFLAAQRAGLPPHFFTLHLVCSGPPEDGEELRAKYGHHRSIQIHTTPAEQWKEMEGYKVWLRALVNYASAMRAGAGTRGRGVLVLEDDVALADGFFLQLAAAVEAGERLVPQIFRREAGREKDEGRRAEWARLAAGAEAALGGGGRRLSDAVGWGLGLYASDAMDWGVPSAWDAAAGLWRPTAAVLRDDRFQYECTQAVWFSVAAIAPVSAHIETSLLNIVTDVPYDIAIGIYRHVKQGFELLATARSLVQHVGAERSTGLSDGVHRVGAFSAPDETI